MVDFYFPGFRQKAKGGQRIDQMFGSDSLIAGLLISKAYFDEFYTHWKGDLQKARSYYDSLGMKLFGDSGAFSFVDEPTPPISVQDVIDFYNQIDADIGASLDHVVPDYDAGYDYFFGGLNPPQKYTDRMGITIQNGRDFLTECRSQGVRFEPIGSVQGWSPKSYVKCVQEFQKMGYKKLAIGGIAKLSKPSIRELMASIKEVVGDTELHLFGITQPQLVRELDLPNITSVDGMGPHLGGVIRGEYFQTSTKRHKCFPITHVSEETQSALDRRDYDQLRTYADPTTNFDVDQTLEELKGEYWKGCDCIVCTQILGSRVAFHHSDTARHRGFHNLYVIAKEFKQGVG